MNLLSPPCPVCGLSNSSRPIVLRHILFKCLSCGLLFSDRICDPSTLSVYYRDDENGFFSSPYFNTVENVDKHPEYSNYVAALDRVRGSDSKRQRLLDFGCGTGVLLEIADRMGFEAEGLEIHKDENYSLGKHVKIHVYDGDVSHLPNLNTFDVITIWDVLEHLPNPVTVLKKLRTLLKPGGKFLIRTVNEDCILSYCSLLLLKLGLKAPANRMHEVYHVVYFSPQSLNLCIKRAGLKSEARWLGEMPVERVSINFFIRLGLSIAYVFQKITGRTYEQYVIASQTLSIK